MSLPTNGAQSAVRSSLLRVARAAGRQVVRLIARNIRPSDIMTLESLENAMAVHSAIGGSTNAVIHLPAIAGELGLELLLEKWNLVSAKIPHLANITAGSNFTMQDLDESGGIPAVMKELGERLHRDALTVTGQTLADNIAGSRNLNPQVIRPVNDPVFAQGAIAVLKGNLAPNGAVVKQTAVASGMLEHQGPARVFDSEDGAKEALLAHRIVALVTDGRFSGWNRGPAIGHVSPEAADGGPIALVRDGDVVRYSIPRRELSIEVPEEEMHNRGKPEPPCRRPLGGFLGNLYPYLVGPVERGAVLEIPPSWRRK
jgi:dihydroxy-acid dehydratase